MQWTLINRMKAPSQRDRSARRALRPGVALSGAYLIPAYAFDCVRFCFGTWFESLF